MIFYAKAHDQTTWALIAILSLMGALAQILLTTALRHAPVAAVITMDYSALLWSVLFGWLIFNDIPGPSIWLGAPLVIAAGIIIAWREHHQEQKRKILQTTHPGD
jgi:drug/metabolite transporter (DMT)-like permease